MAPGGCPPWAGLWTDPVMEAWYHPLHCMNDPQAEGHMASYIRRRKFLAMLGGAAVAWPLAVRAEQPAMPVVAFINGASAVAYAHHAAAFRNGLDETGYIEG